MHRSDRRPRTRALAVAAMFTAAIVACGARTPFRERRDAATTTPPLDASPPDVDASPVDAPAPDDSTPVDAITPPDDGPVVPPDVPRVDGGRPCNNDLNCFDGVFCNGRESCVDGQCVDGPPPCPTDAFECTDDLCDEAGQWCPVRYNHARCAPGDRCNAPGQCAPFMRNADARTGCIPPDPGLGRRLCEDGDRCTVDGCTPTGCTHASRDLDGDGAIDETCAGGTDCNDANAAVRPGVREVCTDEVDNNCDGRIDTGNSDVCPSTNDRCANAFLLTATRTYGATMQGMADDVTLPCNAGPTGRPDAFFRFEVTTPSLLSAFTDDPELRAALALYTAPCGGGRPLACELRRPNPFSPPPWAGPEITAPRLTPGTYYLVVETSHAADYRLNFRLVPVP